jgi:hypothetical protein
MLLTTKRRRLQQRAGMLQREGRAACLKQERPLLLCRIATEPLHWGFWYARIEHNDDGIKGSSSAPADPRLLSLHRPIAWRPRAPGAL